MMEDLRDLLEEFEGMEPTCEACGEPVIMVEGENALPDWKHVDESDHDVNGIDVDDEDRYESLIKLVWEFGDVDYVRGQANEDSTLIPEHEFEDYARQLAEDIGAISGDEGWPLSYIDWERAADALKQDYSCIEWDGTDYYYRSV